ncbi:MAG: hypothetical protein AAF597_19030, partial [Bacteroidota bacterium]
MRLSILVFALLATNFLTAQLSVDAQTPVMAYQTETESTASAYDFSPRRERTLLGDLDLSGAWGGPTYNYSMTGEDWALVRGGFGGLEFGEDFFLGYGGWKGRENFTVDDPIVGSPEFEFQHSGFIFAYSPFRDNAIHPRISTIIGPGKANVVGEGSDRFLVGQGMVGLELNLFQWFRLGADVGYRFANGVDLVDVTDQDVS